MKKSLFIIFVLAASIARAENIVDTGQKYCYSNKGKMKSCPKKGSEFSGQDAQYNKNNPLYKDNKDGTVTDLNTGLMWTQAVDLDKVSLKEAKVMAERMSLGGYKDWRVPNIKELYSLIDFNGYTGFAGRDMNSIPNNAVPFINEHYFDFEYGDIANGERYIDAQWLSATEYVSKTMDGAATLFGVNFADGRIKGYPHGSASARRGGRGEKKFYVRFVRGNPYGKNEFIDNGDDTVTDNSTGLIWQKNDSKNGMDWAQALKYCQNLSLGGYDDWRLPNAKELQYIVDYTRSPDTTNSPSISPKFNTSSIKNESGQKDYPYFWTSTTHMDGPKPGNSAAYISFGRAIGKMGNEIMDVHGAGAQRSDPKKGKAGFRGPQGDALRSNNYVRCVRGN